MPIPVDEYLRTTCRPDCDYVDGEVIERDQRARKGKSFFTCGLAIRGCADDYFRSSGFR